MRNWLKSYEDRRLKEPNESWGNSRYGPQYMNWQEAQAIYIKPLKKTVGKSWFALSKLWQDYKKAGVLGKERSSIAYEIARYQKGLDLPIAPLPELETLNLDLEFGQEGDVMKSSQLDQTEEEEVEELPWSEESEADEDDWDFDKWKAGDDNW